MDRDVQDPEALEKDNDEVIGLLAGKAEELRAVRARFFYQTDLEKQPSKRPALDPCYD